MQDHDFTSSSHSGKPYYYVFIKGDAPVGKTASRFFRFDTAPEAAALYQYLETEHSDYDLSLGIHKDYARRADIIERIDGVNVLSDSLSTTSPWKDDPSVAKDAAELSHRLRVAWKIDRELVGRPILVPNERERIAAPSFLEGKALLPDAPGDPKSSIREVSIRGLGWMSFGGLKSHAASCNRGAFPKPPLVERLLVDYQVIEGPGCGSVSMTPAEYKFLEMRYLAQQQGREVPQVMQQSNRPIDELKQEAKARVQNRPRTASKSLVTYDNVL